VNPVVCVRGRERRGRVATTGSVPSGANGHLGLSAAPPVARGRGPGRELVMEQTSE